MIISKNLKFSALKGNKLIFFYVNENNLINFVKSKYKMDISDFLDDYNPRKQGLELYFGLKNNEMIEKEEEKNISNNKGGEAYVKRNLK